MTISGWVGVIIEKITSGYLERFATDVVAVNSRSDLRRFQPAGSGSRSTDNLVLSGLPFLTGGFRGPRARRTGASVRRSADGAERAGRTGRTSTSG